MHSRSSSYRILDTDVCGDCVGSRIIFFSTALVTASHISPNYLLYVSTKGATEQLSRVLAKDFGTRGITVNTVAPGPIDTDLFRQDKTEQQINFIAGLHPQKRLGTAEEVSNVVSFLVSEEASWVNGQTLRVSGVSTLIVRSFRVRAATNHITPGLCCLIPV